MKTGLYSKLAIDGIKKNGKLYIPYIISVIGMVAITYVLRYLSEAPALSDMQAGNNLRVIMALGTVVMISYAVYFLAYTNSFLAKRRNSEFALYNILGMNKKNIIRIIAREYVYLGIAGIGGGLSLGVLLSKLFELILMKMCGYTSDFIIYFSKYGMLLAAAVYAVILFVMFIFASLKVLRNKPIDLLKSKHTGERAPKANVLFAIIGLVLMAYAYYIAVTIKSPVSAIEQFFLAVLMVIAGTYMLFISGSVMLCKILKKNKSYYYTKKHFVSLSGMIYRMKRNGMGLASICILSTMVLVMISSTGSLFFGKSAAIRFMQPYDFNVAMSAEGNPDEIFSKEAIEDFDKAVEPFSKRDYVSKFIKMRNLEFAGNLNENIVSENVSGIRDAVMNTSLVVFSVYPLDDYNLSGDKISLGDGEALLLTHGIHYKYDSINVIGHEYKIVGKTDSRIAAGSTNIIDSMTLVVKNFDEFVETVKKCNSNEIYYFYNCSFDTKLSNEDEKALLDELRYSCNEKMAATGVVEIRQDFVELYSSLFLLGIFLSIAFMGACVLIMYYKQITEGYEDAANYKIMRNVGMTKKEIEESVNSQTLITFFSPLLAAGLHLAFSAPLVYRILILFGVSNLTVFIITYIGCFFVFSLFYLFAYKKTVKAYVDIVAH